MRHTLTASGAQAAASTYYRKLMAAIFADSLGTATIFTWSPIQSMILPPFTWLTTQRLLPACPAGVLICLIGEGTTGLGLLQQTADHPLIVIGSLLLISFASYAPIAR
jgi:hypothetical protein